MIAILTPALQAIAFLIKHWKLVLLVLSLGGMGIEGFHLARSWDRQAALVAEASTLKARIATMDLVASEDAQRATANAHLNNQLDTLTRETPHNDGPCLDINAARRVRAIKGSSVPAPVPARRHPIVLPGSPGNP